MYSPFSGAETAFEKARGISDIRVSINWSQVHIEHLTNPVPEHRIRVLEKLKTCSIKIQLLKLNHDGLSFLIKESDREQVSALLSDWNPAVSPEMCIISIFAVNVRDEEGLIARIIGAAISSGARLEHAADMHDRLLIAARISDADQIITSIRSGLSEDSK